MIKKVMAERQPREKDARITPRLVVRYTLLQIPTLVLLVLILLLLRQWIEISSWIFWGLIVLKIAADVVLFPFLWKAYDWDRKAMNHPMIGLTGKARDHLDPEGYVLVRGELWRAEVKDKSEPVEAGAAVRVREVRGLTLIVEPERKSRN